MSEKVRGYVLAGGKSSRMGADKARLALGGLPMAAAVAEVLAEAGLAVTLVRRGPSDGLPWIDRAGVSLSVLHEPLDVPLHPLSGLATALEDARGRGAEGVLVCPCDLCGLHADAVARMLDAPCVAAGADGRRHLLAHVPVSWQAQVVAAAQAGASVRHTLRALPSVELPDACLHNVNRPEDRPERPLAALAARLPQGTDVAPVIAAERVRLRHRGIVEPAPPSVSCDSQATDPGPEEG